MHLNHRIACNGVSKCHPCFTLQTCYLTLSNQYLVLYGIANSSTYFNLYFFQQFVYSDFIQLGIPTSTYSIFFNFPTDQILHLLCTSNSGLLLPSSHCSKKFKNSMADHITNFDCFYNVSQSLKTAILFSGFMLDLIFYVLFFSIGVLKLGMYFAMLSCWNFQWCVLMIGLTTFTATTKRVQYVIRYSSSQTRFLPGAHYPT